MLSPQPGKAACMKIVKEKLSQIDIHNWENEIASNGRDENNGNKLKLE